MSDADTQVSHEQDGRTLSGVGVSADRLAETMDRHAPEEPAAPAPEAGAPPEAPVTRGRQRFSDLTRERDEAKAAADTAKAEREALARERDELKSRLEQPREPARETPQPAAAAPAAKEPTRPEPSEDEIGTKYQTYAEFTRDQARWVLEQYQAEQQGGTRAEIAAYLASEREAERFQSAIQSSQERARKAYPDFEALLNSPSGNIPLGRNRDESIERVAFVANHPQSEHIQYAILKDAALAQRLGASDPYTFGVTIAGLIPAPVAARPAWTPPPSPHPTVGASSPTVGKSSADLIKAAGTDFDKSGYREKRAAERKLQR